MHMGTRFTRIAAATTLAGSTLVGGGVAGAHDDLPGQAPPPSASTAFTWLDPADATAYEAELARFREALARFSAALAAFAQQHAAAHEAALAAAAAAQAPALAPPAPSAVMATDDPAVAGGAFDKDGCDRDGDGVPDVAGAGWDREGWGDDGWDRDGSVGDHDEAGNDRDGWDGGRSAGWGGGHHHR
jgi:hypothetical protein